MAKAYQITKRQWQKYITMLRRVQNRATDEMIAFINLPQTQMLSGAEYSQAIIDYGYALATKYGEAASALVCDWYDAISMAEGVELLAAEPAETATYQEVAKAINGTRKFSEKPEVIGAATGRQVKLVAADTLLKNALRDGAEWAWIPQGETCAFCLTLASRGWQAPSTKALKNGHAEHIHANCDCMYAVRHNPNTEVEGYNDGQRYRDMYYDAPLDHWNTPDGEPPAGHNSAEKPTPKNRINAMRRKFYSENGTEEFNVDL